MIRRDLGLILISKKEGGLPCFPPFFNPLYPPKPLKFNILFTEKKSMNYRSFIALFALSFSTFVNAQEFERSASKITAQGEDGLNKLQVLSEQDPMKGYIEGCKTSLPQSEADDRGKLLNCAWDKLSDDEKKDIYALLESDPESDESNKYSPGLSNFKKEKSSATKILEKYLMGRLEAALYGEDESGNTLKVAADHTDFYRIYQSQLGKSLITELANFCIYADEDGKFKDGDTAAELEKIKEENLKKLSELNNEGTQSKSYAGYSKCITTIGDLCEQGKSPAGVDISPCELNRLMTSVKNSLATTEDLIETFEERESGSSLRLDGVDKDGKRGATINGEAVNINKVTNIGSKELLKDSGYEEEMNKIAQDLEKNCKGVQNPEQDPKCKDYLTKKSDNERMLLEYELRNKALAQKVNDELTEDSSEEKLKSILKEQGLSDEEYENLKAKVAQEMSTRTNSNNQCATVEACIKEKIVNRYENERKQLVKSLERKLEQTQYDDTADPQSSNATAKIEDMTKRYQNSATDLAKVYQYSNIVSSFIEVGSSGSGNRNTAALAAELESNYFDPNSNSRGTASQGSGASITPVDLSELSGLAGGKSKDAEAVNLESSQINEIQGWTSKEKSNSP